MRRALLLCAVAAALQGLAGCCTCTPWVHEPFGPYTGCDPANCTDCGGCGSPFCTSGCGPCDVACGPCEVVDDCGPCEVGGGYSPYGPDCGYCGPGGVLSFVGRVLGLSWPCGGCSSDVYYGDFHSYPPDCCDPCDRCGNWTGYAGEPIVDHPLADVPRGHYAPRGSSVATRSPGLLREWAGPAPQPQMAQPQQVVRSAPAQPAPRVVQQTQAARPTATRTAQATRMVRSAPPVQSSGNMRALASGPMPSPPHSDVYPPKLISVTDEVVKPATAPQAQSETEVAQAQPTPPRPIVRRTSATQRR